MCISDTVTYGLDTQFQAKIAYIIIDGLATNHRDGLATGSDGLAVMG